MLKRILSIALSLIFCFGILSVGVTADERTMESEADDILEFIQKADSVNVTDDHIQVVKTTPLSTKARSNNTAVESYKAEFVNFVALNPQDLDALAAEVQVARARGGGNSYQYVKDDSLTIRIYTNIYYDNISSGGDTYVDMTRIEGGIIGSGSGIYFPSGVQMTSAKANMTQQGFPLGGSITLTQIAKKDYSTVRSWTYTPSWKPVVAVDGGSLVGVYYAVTLKRGTSTHTWTTELDNFLYR